MTTTQTDKPIALLDWSLNVDCPSCKEEIDLVEYDSADDYHIAQKIFSNAWSKLEGFEITCPHCQHEFELGKVEY